MRKVGLLIILVLVLEVITIPSLIKQKVGDIRPALLPPATTQKKVAQKTGETVSYLNVPSGFIIGIFAQEIEGARDLEFSPQGTLLVSSPSNGAVVALPDKNNDGVADKAITILSRLNKPHGIAFFEGKLFVAEETQVARYNWDEASLSAKLDKVLFELPKSSGHVTRTITFKKDGRMFVSIGSTCNVCYEKNEFLAAVIVSNAEGEKPKLWAKGLRNSVFITVNPSTDELWGTEMGRDFLGDNLPPDEINIIKDNNPSTGSGPWDYGWPECYGNKVQDSEFKDIRPVYILVNNPHCFNTQPPIFEIPAHSAPLGLTFIDSKQFPKDWQGDLLVAYHGSWNSSVPVGYKVVRMNVKGDKILREEDFITGFINGSQAIARPVDVIFEPSTSSGQGGSLFISDDKGGNIYKIIKK